MAKPDTAESPNPEIDKAIKNLMGKVSKSGDDSVPPDVAVKIINTAIAWEKVKYHIRDDPNSFDPDSL